MDRYIDVAQCAQPQTQFCRQGPSVSVKTDGPLMVEFTANNHCSHMIAYLIVDGREWDPTGLAPAQPDCGYLIPVKPGGPHHRCEG